jgi:hypothetical protein
MSNLRGFLWSMGRSGTKVIIDTINEFTDADQLSWVDTPRFIDAPRYFFTFYPRPFCLTLHVCHHTAKYEEMLRLFRATPVVFAVRDPIPHLRSYARVFLNSYIARRVDNVVAHAKTGQTIVSTINPRALDEAHVPTFDYWRHWSTIKESPHKVVDFSDLKEGRFVQTLNEVCDLFGLKRTRPISWPGIANSESDSFIINYTREFPIVDRMLQLRFTRWKGLWSEPGLVTLGALRSPLLDEMIGAGSELFVQAKADQLLTSGSIEREREAFSEMLADEEMKSNLAAAIVEDYNIVSLLVERELDALHNILLRKYNATYRDGVNKFLVEQPEICEKWNAAASREAA